MAPDRLSRVLSRLSSLKNWEQRSGARAQMKEIDSSACAQLCEGLGRPQRNLSVVHVAGSKGKGTVASLVGAGLSGAGHRVCVMTSPHVDCVTERVRVGKDLAPVSRETLADSLEKSLDEASREASWFDVFVAASLDVAARSRCDYAVVECGLGGRLDSTNFLGAKIAALTSVEFEHTEVLGDTLAKIAREKAAIATRGGYLVCGNCVPLSARRSARAVARRRGAAFLRAPKGRSTVFGASNMGLAQTILKLLRIKQRRSFLEEGARKALPARRERLSPDVLVDGAHTPESVGELSKYLRGHNIVALVALGTDKNVERFAAAVLEDMRPRAVICTRLEEDEDEGRLLLLKKAFEDTEERMASADTITTRILHQNKICLDDARALCREYDNATLAVFGSFKLCGVVKKQHLTFPLP